MKPANENARPSYRQTYGYLPEPCVRLLESGPDGEELMLRVIGRLGGATVRIPVKLTTSTILVRALGDADAARVWQVWRGQGFTGEVEVDVPRMSAAYNKARRARLLALIDSGVTVQAAALRYGVTERTIYNMLARAKALGETFASSSRQMDMFPAR